MVSSHSFYKLTLPYFAYVVKTHNLEDTFLNFSLFIIIYYTCLDLIQIFLFPPKKTSIIYVYRVKKISVPKLEFLCNITGVLPPLVAEHLVIKEMKCLLTAFYALYFRYD